MKKYIALPAFYKDKLFLIDAKNKSGQKYPMWQFIKPGLVSSGLDFG